MMTAQQKMSKTIAATVLAGLLLTALAWAAHAASDSKLDTGRFVADSISRDAVQHSDHEILMRIDDRTRAMYCAGKPPGCQ